MARPDYFHGFRQLAIEVTGIAYRKSYQSSFLYLDNEDLAKNNLFTWGINIIDYYFFGMAFEAAFR